MHTFRNGTMQSSNPAVQKHNTSFEFLKDVVLTCWNLDIRVSSLVLGTLWVAFFWRLPNLLNEKMCKVVFTYEMLIHVCYSVVLTDLFLRLRYENTTQNCPVGCFGEFGCI